MRGSQQHTVCSTTTLSLSHFWSFYLTFIYLSVSLSLFFPPACPCHPHIALSATVPTFVFLLLPSLMLRCTPCLPMWIIHGLWGFRCGERIRSLAWAVFLSAHLLGSSRSQRLSSCWEEYWVTSNSTHTQSRRYRQVMQVYAETPMQTFMYAICVHEDGTWMQMFKLHGPLCGYDTVLFFSG